MTSPDLNEADQEVFRVLAERKAMPFLELSSFFKLPDEEITAAVRRLSDKGFVTIVNPSSEFDQIISVTGVGFQTIKKKKK